MESISEEICHIDSVPDDILLGMFKSLQDTFDIQDCRNCREICKRWNNLIDSHILKLEYRFKDPVYHGDMLCFEFLNK